MLETWFIGALIMLVMMGVICIRHDYNFVASIVICSGLAMIWPLTVALSTFVFLDQLVRQAKTMGRT